jgi:hypothetical protein
MTNLLVEDPYFPYTFPFVYDYYQEHGAVPLPEDEEEDDEEAAPILVQIAPPNNVKFVVEGVEENPEEEEPEENPEEEEPEENPEEEEPEENPEENPVQYHNPPAHEADWEHEIEEPNPNLPSDDEEEEGWQADDEEGLVYAELPEWLRVTPDIMDIDFDSSDVPPPPFEDDIGAYKAHFPHIF